MHYKHKYTYHNYTSRSPIFTQVLVLQVHALGSGTMKSVETWGDRQLAHRKREGYIAAYRSYFELGNYKNWNKFREQDFKLRASLTLTFNKRHLPLSDGLEHKEFADLLEVPEEWLEGSSPKKITSKPTKKKPDTKIATPPKKKIKIEKPAAAAAAADVPVPKLVMDPLTGQIRELIEID